MEYGDFDLIIVGAGPVGCVLAERETAEKGIHFCGRLATYSYLNIDEVVESALELHEVLKRGRVHAGPLGPRSSL